MAVAAWAKSRLRSAWACVVVVVVVVVVELEPWRPLHAAETGSRCRSVSACANSAAAVSFD